MDVTRPLEGIRVVDLTSVISGPAGTQMLGDQGADIIKVEKWGVGDGARHMGGKRGGFGGAGIMMNRSKRSIMLDVRKPEGAEIVRELAASADVFVQNMRPGVTDRLGIGYAAIKDVNPDIIYCSLSGFGLTGPNAKRRVYDAVIQGSMIFARQQADPDTGEPHMITSYLVDKVTAVTCAQAILAAIIHRMNGGGGQHLQLSMMDAGLHFVWLDGMWNHTYVGDGVEEAPYLNQTYKLIPTKNGHISMLAPRWDGLCRALKREDMLDDVRFSTPAERLIHRVEFAKWVREEFIKWDTDELCERLYAEEQPAAKVYEREEVFEDAQVLHNELIVEYIHPTAGPIRQPRPPALFDGKKTKIGRPAPTLGQHTVEILREIGKTDAEIAALHDGEIVGENPPELTGTTELI